MGFFSPPNPMQWITDWKDDKLKRSIEQIVVSMAYSQYITFLYQLGKALKGRKLIGFLGDTFMTMAASCYQLLASQDTEKIIYLSVPKELAQNQALLGSISCVKEQGGK
jgi:hypothetical protein